MRFDIRNKEDETLIGHIKIYLNGIEVRKCVMADEEAGVIERWRTDRQGRVVAFQEENGKQAPRLIQERGTVRIEIAE